MSVTCGCGEILTRDGCSELALANEAAGLGWCCDGVWMCPGCVSVDRGHLTVELD